MTEEEKKAAEAAAAEEAKKAEAEALIANLSDEEKEQKRQKALENKIDFAAELEKERKLRFEEEDRRKKAEKALADKDFHDREDERQRKIESGNDGQLGEDKPLTASQLETILARERQETNKFLQSQKTEQLVRGMATSEDETQLILEIHKNRSWPSYIPLEKQVKEAFAIANADKLIGERNEALRALKGRQGVTTDSAVTYHDSPKPGEPHLEADTRLVLQQTGFTWNSSTSRYEKKLGNGNILYKDMRTNKVHILKKQ